MARKIAITVFALIGVVVVLGGIKGLQISELIAQGKSYTPPPEVVTASKVNYEHWAPTLTAIGSVVASQGVTVSAEGSGTVRRIAFESGAVVRQGTLLVTLDTDTEQAELASAEATATLKKLTLERTQRLFDTGAVAKAALDTAQAEATQSQAQVNNIRSIIAKKTIRAPFSGRLGIRQVNVGEFLNAGAPIVSLQSFDPILIDFSLPQQHVATVKTGQTVYVTSNAFAGKEFKAELTAINPDVDVSTRNVRMQATLSNPEGQLRPGMFVDVKIMFSEPKKVLTVPATAVIYAPYGDSVFVVEKGTGKEVNGATQDPHKLFARQQFVRLEETRGDMVAVLSGLKEGQQVVTSGAFKLRPGAEVKVSHVGATKPHTVSTPSDS